MTSKEAAFSPSATPLSTNKHLLRWIEKMADLTKPAAIHWVNGSLQENDDLCRQMLESGTFIRLNQEQWPACYLRALGCGRCSPRGRPHLYLLFVKGNSRPD